MEYFYRVRKVNRRYILEFKVVFNNDFSNVFSVTLDNYRNTHNLHSTGLDCYGLVAGARVVGFASVNQLSGWLPFAFSGSDDYFFIEFPTNFGYVSKRGHFLRTGDFHLRANFRFQDFYAFIAGNGILIF